MCPVWGNLCGAGGGLLDGLLEAGADIDGDIIVYDDSAYCSVGGGGSSSCHEK